MSLATRCTHCGTIFKVVQDQLKVSEGWVRCGRCNEVFNALPTLFDLERDPPPQRVTPPAPLPADAPNETEEEVPALPSSPPPSDTPDWAATGVLAATDIDPALDTPWQRTEPSAWSNSIPAATHDTAYDITRDITQDDGSPADEQDPDSLPPQPAVPLAATTDFELDTAIGLDGEPLPEPMAVSPTTALATEPGYPLSPSVQPWLDEPPDDVPSMEEADALDSRYLLPSFDDRTPRPHRRNRGPEFADAQFPSDALQDAQDDWASDFGASNLPAEPPDNASPFASHLATPPGHASPALGEHIAPEYAGSPQNAIGPMPAAAPAFVPEQVVPPPSRRFGRPGSRGRDPATQTPDFVRRAHRRAMWRHPAVRGMLTAFALVLSLGLGLQLVHQFRDLIAAYHPQTQPWLAQWCQVVGCQLAPPLRLDELQVESATLVRAVSEGPDRYRLSVVVHNRAPIALAWPHVDLTLTDQNGAVVARRAFSPNDAQWLDTADPKTDLPTGPRVIGQPVPAAVPGDRSTTLLWQLRSPEITPAGYTAELFYP